MKRARTIDKILVVDVESTCWRGDPPAGQVSEIVQIGICTVDVASLERGDKRSILIRPTGSEVSPFCTNLTGLTAEMLCAAGTLADAAALLKREFKSEDRVWASWGDYDRRQLETDCTRQDVPYPFGTRHLNVKTLFALAHCQDHELGLGAAFKLLGLEMEGTHHHGDDDAWNIARLLCLLLQQLRG